MLHQPVMPIISCRDMPNCLPPPWKKSVDRAGSVQCEPHEPNTLVNQFLTIFGRTDLGKRFCPCSSIFQDLSISKVLEKTKINNKK